MPVKERIDHEEAKRIAEAVRDYDGGAVPYGFTEHGARRMADEYLALFTEHFAREHPLGCEACMVEIRKAVARGVTYLDNSMLCSDALPATESAQPEEERR